MAMWLNGPVLPRWTVTCAQGHVKCLRAERRPNQCPTCGGALIADQIDTESRVGRKPSTGHQRPSGSAALFHLGDGRRVRAKSLARNTNQDREGQ